MSPPPYHTKDTLGFHLKPNFDDECRECGESPTVVVVGHEVPQTGLCGRHFFNDRQMMNWELWSNKEDEEQSDDE